MLLLLGAAAIFAYILSKVKMQVEGGPNTDKTTCDEKYCPPAHYQTWIDRPMNTLLTDQSHGAGLALGPPQVSLATPYYTTKAAYRKGVMQSPGVHLVAGKIK